MRMIRQGWRFGGLIAAGLILSSGAFAGADAPPMVHVKAVVDAGAVRLDVQANVPFEYATYRPSKNLYVLDMTGVSSGDAAGARVVDSELIKSYRVVSYTAGQKPVVRLEILLSDGVEPRIERQDPQDLALLVVRTPGVAPAANSSIPAAPAAVPVAVKSPEAKGPGTALETIRQVSLTQNRNQTQVSILGTAPLNCHAIRLQNPDRIVLDFAGSHLGAPVRHQIASNLDPVREIRLAQFAPEVSRVVIDLREPSDYKMDTAGNSLTVSFTPAATGAVQPAPAEPVLNLTTTKVQSSKTDGQETVAAGEAQIPAPAEALPAVLTQASSALARPAVAQVPLQPPVAGATQAASDGSAAPSNGATAAPAAESQPPVQAPSTEAATQTVEVPTPAPTPGPSSKYSGEPISVNLKDVDLRDFFRLIHEISGLNVVVDPAVTGNLTIVLEDVPWDQALDIVLHNNDLDKQLDGNVLRIATKATLRKEADESRDLVKAQAEAADLVTTTRKLSYTKAADMAALLKKFLSPRGDILADTYSNSLIIRDIQPTLPVIDNLLRQLDRKSLQVEIDARVVEADRNFSRQLGTELSLAGRSGNSALGGTTAVGQSETNFTPAPPIIVGSGTSGPIPSVLNLGTSAPTSGIQYLFASPNFALDFVIDAAESRGVGKLLSEPKVITQNNQKATVKQGVKIPVQTVVNNTITVLFVDAVLELDVTPQITSEGTIYMDVTVENDQPNNEVEVLGTPEIITESTETKVTVDDGATVVIGGIIVTNQQTAVDQVPILGSVPLLGNLFKHTTVSSTSKELLFFLTPRILPS